MKVYKRSLVSAIYFLIIYAIGSGFVYFISSVFTEDKRIVYGLTALVIAAGIYSMISGFKFKVVIDQGVVTFHEGRKSRSFVIDQTSFECKRVNNDDMSITATSKEGESGYFDCSFLGNYQFDLLLDDLKVTGENQTVYKLPTTPKT